MRASHSKQRFLAGYDDKASTKKILQQKLLCSVTTSSTLGFRMCGMQVRCSTSRRSLQLVRVWALTRHSRAVLAKRAAELRGARQAVGLQTEGKHHAGMYQHLSACNTAPAC